MGHVHLIRWVAVLGAARAVTVIVRGDGVEGGWLFLAGSLAAVAGLSPWFMAAGATAASLSMAHPTGSVVLFAWVAALCALLDGEDLRHAIRWQVVVVYGFAVVHKLISPAFLSGSIIAVQLPALPHPELAALGVICLETFLAVAVLRRWPIALPVAVAAHVSFVAGMSQSPVHAVALGAFNLHMILLICWSSRWAPELSPDTGRVGGAREEGARGRCGLGVTEPDRHITTVDVTRDEHVAGVA